jgi:hypothetical protein
MTAITIPDLGSVISCPWADRLDAAALRDFAKRIRTVSERPNRTLPFGSDTMRVDPNGVYHPSTFGTKMEAADGGMLAVSLGRTREHRAVTDDLRVSLTRADGPAIAFEIRVPIIEYVGRPDGLTAQMVASGLMRLSRRLGGARPVRESVTATTNLSLIEALASLLAHRPALAGKAKLAIDMTPMGPSIEAGIVDGGYGDSELDGGSTAMLARHMTASFDLFLHTQGGDLGKRWAAHDSRFRVKVPAQAPDAVTTMRLMADFGLIDMPDIA